ncbi:hypothetical protein H6P81_006167 [Aristolochia fimbriata]|uniref:Legume lectin domain-containing protein n=1 Tax=Aristolochia fimbriata TaxID=158543 RepID=A0AAV7EWQ8_ARIFI|nr:hypothetical protein H6P81_006167 [Aristolochia fimbriata]
MREDLIRFSHRGVNDKRRSALRTPDILGTGRSSPLAVFFIDSVSKKEQKNEQYSEDRLQKAFTHLDSRHPPPTGLGLPPFLFPLSTLDAPFTRSLTKYCALVLCWALCILALSTRPISCFSFSKFDNDRYFGSQISLYGDAEISSNDSSLRLARSSLPSWGRIMSKRPIKISPRNPTKVVSFCSYFSFAVSPGNTDGLAFFMVPKDLSADLLNNSSFGVSPGVLAVEFDTFKDHRFKDPNANHVGLDIGSLISVVYRDAAESKLVLNSGVRLHCWIDYDLNSRQLEVRVSKSGAAKPLDPFISYRINLSEMFGRGVFVGISSSSRNGTQATSVYSWSLELKRVANFIHSEPVDPQTVAQGTEQKLVRYKSDYLLRSLAGMILGAGCGAMVALIVLFVWSMLENKHHLAPSEYPVYPADVGLSEIETMKATRFAQYMLWWIFLGTITPASSRRIVSNTNQIEHTLSIGALLLPLLHGIEYREANPSNNQVFQWKSGDRNFIIKEIG